ncbi:class I SAM-dependent methyltransferase [Paraglaciecola chathamensis]|uniref:class I SAM-dependent methyltransferase n=1 Tax=Paraglaciecola chathamensis TaxID=368405 RepID=UPI0026F4F161|nr:class I SAM-dependent methyltransferase [Paraglaciecola chathamensis]MDO6558197.1 class I SAM-dependent methyltransferase [Paraglaciecola chathamensis]
MEGKLLPDEIVSEYKSRAKKARKSLLEKIPKVKLKPDNIANCQLILNRENLLEYLPSNACVAEIGVDRGEFSRKIFDSCRPQKLHLIDAWHTERYNDGLLEKVETSFSREIQTKQVEINRGLSIEVVDSFQDDYFDWIYIDTSHDYITTKTELEAFSKKMKTNGIIAGHDYSMGNWVEMFKYGVIEAVHEFCVNYNWEMIFITADFTENQSFAIRKIS